MTMESSIASNEPSNLVCETCFKSYQRRDLLMRHRRRCRGPVKSGNRRIACDACVVAKAKCCRTQPTCSRCVKRLTKCVYSAPSAIQASSNPEHREEDSSGRDQRPQSCPSVSSQAAAPELRTWDLPLSPYLLDTFDLHSTDFANLSPVPHLEGLIEKSFTSTMAHGNVPSSSLTQTSSDARSGFSYNTPALSTPLILTRILGDYASKLVKSSCISPFLHLPKLRNVEPDLSSFPFTSMAICSSAAMSISTDKHFFRRAIDAARRQLIGNFPSYECMEQWDAIHAVAIYESLEIREVIGNESEGWRLSLPVKNVEMGFLLKMTRTYVEPYLQIRSPRMDDFSDSKSTPCSPKTTTWGRWRTTETTRRTVFIVNMVNFLNNYDPRTRKTTPYYEPLDDDLILNMPLPCNQTAWLAYEDESYRLAVKEHQPWVNHSLPDHDRSAMEALSKETYLSTILSAYSKERIQAAIGPHAGLGDSDDLRRLIILCATEQFL